MIPRLEQQFPVFGGRQLPPSNAHVKPRFLLLINHLGQLSDLLLRVALLSHELLQVVGCSLCFEGWLGHWSEVVQVLCLSLHYSKLLPPPDHLVSPCDSQTLKDGSEPSSPAVWVSDLVLPSSKPVSHLLFMPKNQGGEFVPDGSAFVDANCLLLRNAERLDPTEGITEDFDPHKPFKEAHSLSHVVVGSLLPLNVLKYLDCESKFLV